MATGSQAARTLSFGALSSPPGSAGESCSPAHVAQMDLWKQTTSAAASGKAKAAVRRRDQDRMWLSRAQPSQSRNETSRNSDSGACVHSDDNHPSFNVPVIARIGTKLRLEDVRGSAQSSASEMSLEEAPIEQPPFPKKPAVQRSESPQDTAVNHESEAPPVVVAPGVPVPLSSEAKDSKDVEPTTPVLANASEPAYGDDVDQLLAEVLGGEHVFRAGDSASTRAPGTAVGAQTWPPSSQSARRVPRGAGTAPVQQERGKTQPLPLHARADCTASGWRALRPHRISAKLDAPRAPNKDAEAASVGAVTPPDWEAAPCHGSLDAMTRHSPSHRGRRTPRRRASVTSGGSMSSRRSSHVGATTVVDGEACIVQRCTPPTPHPPSPCLDSLSPRSGVSFSTTHAPSPSRGGRTYSVFSRSPAHSSGPVRRPQPPASKRPNVQPTADGTPVAHRPTSSQRGVESPRVLRGSLRPRRLGAGSPRAASCGVQPL